MFCSHCGKRIPEDSIFCTFCGHRLRKEEVQQETTAAERPSAPPYEPPRENPGFQPQRAAGPVSAEEAEKKSEGARWGVVFWLFLAMFVAGSIWLNSTGANLPVGSKEWCREKLDDSVEEMQEIFHDLGLECSLRDYHTWRQEGCRFIYKGSLDVSKVEAVDVEVTVKINADFIVTRKSVKLIAVRIEGIPCYQYLNGEVRYYPDLEDDDQIDRYIWSMAQKGEIDGEEIMTPSQLKTGETFSMEAYEKLEEGMTYPRVCTLFMSPGRVEGENIRGPKIMRWGSDILFAELAFEEGRLVSKTIVRPS